MLELDRAVVLVTGGLDGLWQATVAAGAEPVAAANVIANRLAGVDAGAVDAGELAQLVEARDRIPRAALDEALGKVDGAGVLGRALSRAGGGLRHRRAGADRAADPRRRIPGQVAAYRGGKEGLLGFFVGQVMKETGGKANARAVSELVREKLQA